MAKKLGWNTTLENTTDRLKTMGEQSANNPYKGIDPLSGMSGWNIFTDWLGITNNRQNLLNEYEFNSNSWESQYALAMQDREYNDYDSMSARMRRAGINPDLQQFSGSASDVSGATGSSPRQTDAQNQMVSSSRNFAAGLVQVMQFVLGAATGVSSIRNANLMGDMSALAAIIPQGVESAAGYVASQLSTDKSALKQFIEGDSSVARGMIYDIPLPDNLSRSGKRYASRRLSEIFSSNEFRQLVLARVKAENEAATSAAESVGKFEVLNQGEGITRVLGVLARAGYEAMLGERRSSASYSRYGQSYYDSLNPSGAAEVQNAANSYTTAMYQTNEKLRSAYDKMIRNLFRLSEDRKAGWLARNAASVALLGLYTMNNANISTRSGSGFSFNSK